MELTYVGPHDAVEIDLPLDQAQKTQTVVVAHGDSYDFSDEDAGRLLEQPTNWKPAAAAPPKPEAEPPAKKPAAKAADAGKE